MTTFIGFWFDNPDSDLELAISIIEDTIPCKTEVNFWEMPDGEMMISFDIRCREEDKDFVEEMLAPFM